MHRIKMVLITALGAIGLLGSAARTTGLPPMTENLEWKGRVIVEFKSEFGQIRPDVQAGIALLGDAALDAVARQFNVYNIEKLLPHEFTPTNPALVDMSRFYIVEFPQEIDLHEVASAYALCQQVKTAEPYYIRKVSYIPNDTFWNSEYHLSVIHASLAFNYGQGSPDIIVGLVDSGTDTQHVDLRDNLWINPGEDLNGNGMIEPSEWNSVDNDHNGFVDDFWGWNCVNNTNNVQDMPYAGHGTHTAGCASAATDNAIGVAAIGFKAKIMTAKAGDAEYITASVAGITYCANNGANVVSLSYGGSFYSSAEQAAVNLVWSLGGAVIAAAGNNSSQYGSYPAAYDNVVAVASTGATDQLSSYSNYGTWIDVCAPGEAILSTGPGSIYSAWSGTSFSCPITAGLVCLIWATDPTMWNSEVEQILFSTCVNINAQNPGYEGLLGWGRIDAGNALSSLYPNLSFGEIAFTDSSGNLNGRPDPGETIEVFVDVENANPTVGANQVQLQFATNDPDITIIDGTATIISIPGGSTGNINADPFQFSINPAASPHEATFTLTMTEPTLLYPVTRQVVQMIGRPSLVVVDDDSGANYQQWYDLDLDSLDVAHDIWDVMAKGEIPQSELTQYPTAIWHTSRTNSPLSANEQSLISYYLSHGGRLFLTGEDIDEQLAGTPFYANTLHATSLNATGAPQISGVEGDPISDGTNLFLVGSGGAMNSQSPSAISPMGTAALVYTYTTSGNGAGIRWDNTYGMLVYFAFNFEAASGISSTARRVVLDNMLTWFATFGVDEHAAAEMPRRYNLKQNYPNPFNPETAIVFDLPQPGAVNLSVYDLSGRLVEELLQGHWNAGRHTVLFRGDNLASGIYLCKLDAGGAVMTRKMILLK